MARKCSSCGNNGHNSRTCSGHGRVSETGGGGGGVRLFGVQLHVGPSSSPMKKCFSMECLSSAAPPAYYAAALAASSSSPSVSSSSSLVSVEETAEKVNNGYLSDGLMGRAQERKKVTRATPSIFQVENAGRAASSAPDAELPALSLGISRPAAPSRVLPPSLSSLLPRCSAATSGSTSPSGIAAPKHRHPPSSLTPVSKPHQAPDLELKISTADHQTGSSPRTPFFGTIRVT
ncbi:uncharacterized protein C2845_PM08G02820 [Panicum miliaceum]|uniref:CCHC-type domain-containing protein n=1 Tax=Panicum miliaceum TaxID=4540 RepID=A0A3L6QZQ4_PANMI|nr:uncharacterized protein C2845_PM08G02820 [Panicum miliaceum]